MDECNVEYWLDNSRLSKIEYSGYWNDEEKEKSKEWYILNDDFSKMEDYLRKTGLPDDLERCIRFLKAGFRRELKGVGIDLAAGTLWSVPYLFNLGKIDRLYCLEYSKHRLFKIGPKVLEHYNAPKNKIVLAYGDFYDLHIEDSSLDFAFLSSAFHHADKPDKLLSEISRVLKPKGAVIIIGEHIVNYPRAYLNNAIKFFISISMPDKAQKKIFKKTFEVKTPFPQLKRPLPVDPILGDHYYTIREYRSIFSRHGFQIKRLKNHNSQFQSFVLINKNKQGLPGKLFLNS